MTGSISSDEPSTTASLSEFKEGIRVFAESIAEVPVTVASTSTSGLSYLKTTPIIVPAWIDLFHNKEKNRQILLLFAAMQAANAKHKRGFDPNDLEGLINDSFLEGQKRFNKIKCLNCHASYGLKEIKITEKCSECGKKRLAKQEQNPVVKLPQKEILWGIGNDLEDRVGSGAYFTSHFNDPRLMNEVIGIVEKGRVMSCLFQEYEPMKKWFLSLFPLIYRKASRSELMRAPHRAQAETVSLYGRLLWERLSNALILNEKHFEDFIDDVDYYLFPFASILREDKTDNLEDRLKEKTDLLFDKAKTALRFKAGTREVVKSSVDIFFELYEMILKGEINRDSLFVSEVGGTEEREISRTLKRIVRAQDIRQIPKKDESSFEERQEIDVFLPSYHEWDREKKEFLRKHTSVVEYEWDKKEKGFIPKKSLTTLLFGKNEIPIFNKKQLPYPDLDEKIKRELAEKFAGLRPEGLKREGNKQKGRIDNREYARYHAKVRSGVPVRANFNYVLEEKERSVAGMVVIDASGSTGDLITPEHTILDLIKQGCMYIASAVEFSGDPLAVWAATSQPHDMRERLFTYFYPLKDFEEGPDELKERLDYLAPMKNNRDGSILRHAGSMLSGRPEKTKLLFYITDGEPRDSQLKQRKSDFRGGYAVREVQYNPEYKGEYAWDDVASAIREIRAQNIHPLIIRVRKLETEHLQKIGIDFRTVKEDMSDLPKVMTNAFYNLTS